MFSTFAKKIYFILTVAFFVAIVDVNAQDPEPEPPPVEDPGGPQSGGVPVDGGLAILLATGVGYGAKKAYDYRKNKVKSEK
jgi:hypothetical protein